MPIKQHLFQLQRARAPPLNFKPAQTWQGLSENGSRFIYDKKQIVKGVKISDAA